MIEQGFEIPSQNLRKYPIHEMNIGDSILDADAKNTPSSKIRMAANKHGRAYGKKFTCRKVDGGVRVWRIA